MDERTGMAGYDPNLNVAFEDRLGNCYEFAAQYVVRNRGSKLVHGSIQGAGMPRIGHAWAIDQDGEVFEPTGGKHWLPDLFATFHKTQVEVVYDETEARVQMLKHKHYGPWHDFGYGLG